jgi:large subunit ribosomal protein L31
MKNIHPTYGPVVFRDTSAGFTFLTRSTLAGDTAGGPGRPTATIEWSDGNTYPVVDIEISSESHPFWTGSARVVDTAGRIEKFRQRYAKHGNSSTDSTTDENKGGH